MFFDACYIHQQNSDEKQILAKCFQCARTHGDPENRLLRHAQSSTLQKLKLTSITRHVQNFVALSRVQRACVLFSNPWTIAESLPLSCSTCPFGKQMHHVTNVICNIWCYHRLMLSRTGSGETMLHLYTPVGRWPQRPTLATFLGRRLA